MNARDLPLNVVVILYFKCMETFQVTYSGHSKKCYLPAIKGFNLNYLYIWLKKIL